MSIKAISPLDGRYRDQVGILGDYVSEWALIKYRVHVEIEWLITMSQNDWIKDVRSFTQQEVDFLRTLAADFDEAASLEVKKIEATTKHDVKAVEYYIKRRIKETSLADVAEFVHFCCTSEDINNLSYGLMIQGAIRDVWLPLAEKLAGAVADFADQTKDVPMLARTHGQPASPTTVGKELAVFVRRWQRQLKQIRSLEYLGKFNGAVGNFNAHVSAYPDAPWQEIARSLVEGLGLAYNPLTTQIEPHDYLAEVFMALIRFNNILLDFDRDVWSYISLGYFKQQTVAGEIGSSTMPHKVNPINFENSEANVGLSNAMLEHLAIKLPVSRMQRDLTDSSTLRNIGVGVGHSVIAIQAALRGLKQLSVNEQALARDLDDNWEVLGEAVQTVMRKNGHDNPYEKLKDLTRGLKVDAEAMRKFIEGLDLPTDDKARLLELTPATYVGLASQLLKHIGK
ncbi:adenylosuccinate lyase [Effusibacillus lacus]|uniref:Adenylosuccinate lyase n=1 Tax=Effusibacillus lacus TaxID=1348429 RepID=A0A292YK48_9BACL|nr:adenylosuccinate lyase [Effusibacillus lacus]TCS74294.1 adenylosuccinate lyase [Effusibacillus lacus]GAX88754.1 adenylosuccinate lyase [Effusibacillus lacus]